MRDQCSEGRGAQDAEIRFEVFKIFFRDLNVAVFVGIIGIFIVEQVIDVFAVAVQVELLLTLNGVMPRDRKGALRIEDRRVKREVEGPVRNHLF